MSDFVTLLKSKNVVARKQHRCHECHRTINIGEKYLYEATTYEDDFSTHKTCRHCQEVRDYVMQTNFEFIYGCLQEDLCDEDLSDRTNWKPRLMNLGMSRKWTKKNGKLWRVIKA